MISFEQYRDVTILHMGDDKRIVISCDSVGGVGEKSEDRVNAPPEIVGYYGARVALMEMLALKAKPLALINTLSVEMDGYGERIIKGIRKAVSELPEGIVLPVTGSSEENFPMVQTAFGITVIGTLNELHTLPPEREGGEILCLAGLPKVGEEVLSDRGEILTMKDFYHLINHSAVVDTVPVGSKGIAHEIKVLEKSYGKIPVVKPPGLDFSKSGGPSTSALILAKEEGIEELKRRVTAPIRILSPGFKNKNGRK